MLLPIAFDFLPSEGCEREQALLTKLMQGHRQACRNNENISKLVATTIYRTSGSFVQAAAAAMLSVGGRHGPLAAARRDFREFEPAAYRARLESGELLPGLGNDFFKDSIDPAFQPLIDELDKNWPEEAKRLRAMGQIAYEVKKLYLNAALLTGACCEICKVPHGIEEMIPAAARIPVWAWACSQIPQVTFK